MAIGWWRRMGVCGVTVAMVACSPTHNWRNVRHEGVPLQALMPCKPDQAEREVPLLGPDRPPVTLRMLGCDVGRSTFAVATVALPDAAQGLADEAVVGLWSRATWASLRQTVKEGQTAPAGWTTLPVAVSGADRAWRWSGPAQDHRGQTLRAEVLWATGHGWAVQAAVYGPPQPAEVTDTFFEGVRLP